MINIIPKKTKLGLAALLLGSVCTCGQLAFAQPGPKTNTSAAEQEVAAIRKAYQQINTLPIKHERFTYESPGCVEDGVVNYYIQGTNIVKVTESGAIGDGSWVHEFYYSSGKVIFCYELLVGGPAIGNTTKTEYRIYVKNNRALKATADRKPIPVTDSKATEAITTANKIYKAYKNKDFAAALCN